MTIASTQRVSMRACGLKSVYMYMLNSLEGGSDSEVEYSTSDEAHVSDQSGQRFYLQFLQP